MGKKESKMEKQMGWNEGARFLYSLAHEFEKMNKKEEPADTEELGFDLRKAGKIKISIEKGVNGLNLKVKTKSLDSESPSKIGSYNSRETTNYKVLKKRMQKSFKAIKIILHGAEAPDRKTVDAFLKDAERMVSYPGYGDEYYEGFQKVCGEFKVAVEAEDSQTVLKSYNKLKGLKKECHDRYK